MEKKNKYPICILNWVQLILEKMKRNRDSSSQSGNSFMWYDKRVEKLRFKILACCQSDNTSRNCLFSIYKESEKERETEDWRARNAKVTLNIKAVGDLAGRYTHERRTKISRDWQPREKQAGGKLWAERRARHPFVSLSRGYVTSSLKYNRQRVVSIGLYRSHRLHATGRFGMKSVLRLAQLNGRAPSDLAS